MSIYELSIGLLAGILLGGLFFGGLLYTVTHLADWKYPKNVLLISFLLRLALILGGFYLIMQWNGYGIFAALIGFFLIRVYFTRVQAQSIETQMVSSKR